MSSPFGAMRLIANPESGKRSDGQVLSRLTAALERHDLDFDVVETVEPGHATRAARTALDEGRRYLVAVGGDGTVNEVVNGMFDGDVPVDSEAVLGVMTAGSGCDFARTFGVDQPPEVVARHLASDTLLPVDVGVVSYTDSDGAAARRLFVNIAEVGYGAEVVRRAAGYPSWLGRFRYLVGAYGAIFAMRREEATVTTSRTAKTVPVVNLVVANGQFFGGGMKVAPRALPDDGRFNVQIFHGKRSQVFLLTPKLYRGDHLPDPTIIESNAEWVTFEPPERMPLEADGELLGTTPASFALLPRALRVKI